MSKTSKDTIAVKKPRHIRSTNLRIPELQRGNELWEKCKLSTELRYHMSQTDTRFMSHKAHLAIKQTNVNADSIQPSHSELLQSVTTPMLVKFRSGGGRMPEYMFQNEKLAIERERQYQENIRFAQRHMKIVKRMFKEEFEHAHNKIIKKLGPAWYQEPSKKQKWCAENLAESIRKDTEMDIVDNCSFNLGQLGLVPTPNNQIISKALKYCEGDSVEFLLAIFRLLNPNIKISDKNIHYTINDRIVLSALTHLALPATLQEMHIRIPSPPPQPKTPLRKKKRPKKPYYESPYLEPVGIKSKKVTNAIKFDTNTYPDSDYFQYRKQLKMQQARGELSEVSVYKYKYKIDQLDKIIQKHLKRGTLGIKSTSDSEGENSRKDQRMGNETKKTQPTVGQKDGSVTKKLNYLVKKQSNKTRRQKRRSKKRSKQKKKSKLPETYTYYPIHDVDRRQAHTIIAGVHSLPERDSYGRQKTVPIISGLTKMNYDKRSFNYILGGVAILPDGTKVQIINGIVYDPLPPTFSTYVHGGLICSTKGEKTQVVSGIYSKEIPEGPKIPEKPELVDSKKPYCHCESLFHEYVRLKELEHQKCLNMFRQYVITRQKKILKAEPDVTYVMGGVRETEDGPVYILSGIQGRKEPWYEPLVEGVHQMGEKGEPTLIISGMKATRLYFEYMEAVKESLKNMEQTHYIINGVTTSPDGTPKFMISGVTVRKPQTRSVRCHLEGVHYPEKKAVVVTDEEVTNPWLKAKYTAVISGVTPDDDQQPIHIVQGLAKTGYEEPSFTYVLGGVGGKTEKGQPLFVVSGVKEGKKVEEVFRPKCNYIIGGVRRLPDNTKVFMIQGLVLDRDEIPQPCTYVISGITILRNGESVPIIQAVTKRKPVDCECLDLYKRYIKMQEKKHKKCMSLYNRYIRKRERDEARALHERMNATYIIGGVTKSISGDPRFIITGTAAKRIFNEYIKTPEMPQPVLPIIGGVVQTRDGEIVFHIQGFTSHLARKKPVVVIGGVKENRDGSPTYLISSVQAIPSAKPSICDFLKKRQHLERETIMIVGGVKTLDDGTSTFIIDGLTTCDLLTDDEEIIEEPFICKCMRIYNRWLEIELKSYDEEIVEDVGRRVEDVIVPFIKDLPEIETVTPQTIEILPMPKKYYKISCIYSKQIALLQKILSQMADDGYPLALLPFSLYLPHFRVWMNMRCGKVLDESLKAKNVRSSRKQWNHVIDCVAKIPKINLPFTKKESAKLTYEDYYVCKEKIEPVRYQAYSNIKKGFVNRQREFWPTTYAYDFPSKSFLDVFYAYGPSCEPDVLAFRPWATHEHKNLGNLENRCKVKSKTH